MTRSYWLLDLTIGGRVHRYSTDRQTVTTAAGDVLTYEPGLDDVGVSIEGISRLGEGQVDVRIESDTDWAQIVARGITLDGGEGVLRRWPSGALLERARVVLRGTIDSAEYGEVGEALSVRVTRSLRESTREIPSSRAVVDDVCFADPNEDALGESYPIVIGAPGDVGSGSPIPVVPIPHALYRSLQDADLYPFTAIYSRPIWLTLTGMDGSDVRLAAVSGTLADASATTETYEAATDQLGTAYWYADLSYPVPPAHMGASDTVYHAGFAARGTWARAELRGAGDVVAWVLRYAYSGPVDLARLEAARSYLNLWQIDTWIDERVNAWDWLGSEILPLLPVEMRESDSGIYPAIIRYDLTENDARGAIVADQGAHRSSPVRTADGEIRNEIAISYRNAGDRWVGVRVVTATNDRESAQTYAGWSVSPKGVTIVGTDTRVIGHPLAAASQARYGVKRSEVRAAALWDTASAVRTAVWLLERYAVRRRRIRYTLDTDRYETGDAVHLTDAGLHLSSVLCVVVDTTPLPDGAEVDLVLLDIP